MFKVRASFACLVSIGLFATVTGCSGGQPTTDTLDESDIVEDVDQSDVSEDVAGSDAVDGDSSEDWIDLDKAAGIGIAGEWTDEWGTAHDITSSIWTQVSGYGTSAFHVLSHDNGSNHAIAQNDSGNAYSPGLWSRFDWTVAGDTVYFCQTAYDAESAGAAETTTPADPADPATSGCGGFAWTRLTAAPEMTIRGEWTDGWGTNHVISAATWAQSYEGSTSLFNIAAIDNPDGFVVAQNDPSNQYNPGKWSRIDWTSVDGAAYFCQATYDAETQEAAAAGAVPDRADPATGGCGGFAWTELAPVWETMDTVVDAPGATGSGTGDAQMAVNGVRGGGAATGGTDVFSMGATPGDYLTLAFSDKAVSNGPGADFVVFENSFAYGTDSVFMDQIIVLVSRDGTTWVAFPADYLAADETTSSTNPADWSGFAGVTPVLFNQDAETVTDPFDAAAAGGDQFDLADLPDDDPDAVAIKTFGFVFIKLVPASVVLNPDTNAPFASDPMSNGPDIDGVVARYLIER